MNHGRTDEPLDESHAMLLDHVCGVLLGKAGAKMYSIRLKHVDADSIRLHDYIYMRCGEMQLTQNRIQDHSPNVSER